MNNDSTSYVAINKYSASLRGMLVNNDSTSCRHKQILIASLRGMLVNNDSTSYVVINKY